MLYYYQDKNITLLHHLRNFKAITLSQENSKLFIQYYIIMGLIALCTIQHAQALLH